MSSNFILTSFFLLQVTAICLGIKKDDKSWHFDVFEDMENSPKCHVRRRWKHILEPYNLSCFQCQDKKYGAVLYHGTEPFGAVAVRNCQYLSLPWSISMLDAANKGIHRAQFWFEGPPQECVRLNYHYDGSKWVAESGDCLPSRQWRSQMHRYYINGWKLRYEPPNLGVVREIFQPYAVGQGCSKVRTFDHEYAPYSMTCFECQNDFMAVVYRLEEVMGVASVGSCRRPNLEWSITVYPSDTTEYRIQFYTVHNKCHMIAYTKEGGVYRPTVKPDCLYPRPTRISKTNLFMGVLGYLNGWRTKTELPTNSIRTLRG